MTPRAAPVSHCVMAVATEFGLEFDDLLDRHQIQPILSVRRIAMYVAREVTGMSYDAIGRAMRRDGSTVLTEVGKIRDLYRRYEWYRTRLDPLVLRLRQECFTQDCPRIYRNGTTHGTVQRPNSSAKSSPLLGGGS